MTHADRDGSELNRFTSPKETTEATPAPLGTSAPFSCGYCGHGTDNPLGVCGPCELVLAEHWASGPGSLKTLGPRTGSEHTAHMVPKWQLDLWQACAEGQQARAEDAVAAISRVQALHREWERKSLTGGAEDRWRAQAASELNAALGGPAPITEDVQVQTVECGDDCGCVTDAQCPFKPTEEPA